MRLAQGLREGEGIGEQASPWAAPAQGGGWRQDSAFEPDPNLQPWPGAPDSATKKVSAASFLLSFKRLPFLISHIWMDLPSGLFITLWLQYQLWARIDIWAITDLTPQIKLTWPNVVPNAIPYYKFQLTLFTFPLTSKSWTLKLCGTQRYTGCVNQSLGTYVLRACLDKKEIQKHSPLVSTSTKEFYPA